MCDYCAEVLLDPYYFNLIINLHEFYTVLRTKINRKVNKHCDILSIIYYKIL